MDYVPLPDVPWPLRASPAVFRRRFPSHRLGTLWSHPSGSVLQPGHVLQEAACRRTPPPLQGALCPSPRAAPPASCTRAWTPDSQEKRVSPVPFRVRIYLLSPVITLWSLLYSWSLGHTLLTNVVWLLATEKQDKKPF